MNRYIKIDVNRFMQKRRGKRVTAVRDTAAPIDLARSVLRLLGLDLSMPDHTTLSRRGRAFAAPQPRAAKRDGPGHVVLDSTSLEIFGQGEWDAEKHGRTPRLWCKLHLAVDAETGEIMAHVLNDKDVGDIAAVPGLLATVEGLVGSVIAGGAYDGASVYKAASLRQHGPPPDVVTPPRASSIVNTDAAGTPAVHLTDLSFIACLPFGRFGLVRVSQVSIGGRSAFVDGPPRRV